MNRSAEDALALLEEIQADLIALPDSARDLLYTVKIRGFFDEIVDEIFGNLGVNSEEILSSN